MRNKRVVRLTESDLHNIIAESVNRILSEIKIQNPETGEYEDRHGYYGEGGENQSKAANDWYAMADIRHSKSKAALEKGDLETGIKQLNKAKRNSKIARDHEPYLNKILSRK